MLKNWCLLTLVLEKTLETPLDSKEIKPVNLKGDQQWVFTARIDAEAEAPVFWSFDMNRRLTGKAPYAGKDWGQKEKRASEDEMAGWRHQCNEYELGQILGDGEGQGGLECCSPWRAESRTQLGNWTTTAIHSYAFSYFMIFLIGNDHIFKQASTRSYAPGRGDLKIHPRMEKQVWSGGKMQDTFGTQFRWGIWGPWNVVLSEISTQRSTWSSSGLKAIWSCSRHKSDKASQHGAQLSPAK